MSKNKQRAASYFFLAGSLFMTSLAGFGQTAAQEQTKNEEKESNKVVPLKTQKMKVEIWSDVMCPFCYIGKRKFEAALDKFENKENIEIVWKSFQLDGSLKTDSSKNTIQHLAEKKGWTMEYTRNTIKYVTDMAEGVGLHYDFDHAVVANSFDAHRFIQYAKTKGKGDAAEESLFKAYFTEGKNTADHAVLIDLGTQIGLNAEELKKVLTGTDFTAEVNKDIMEAQQIGVNGVPFFVFDRKYAVSGAQDPKAFLETLEKSFAEHTKANPDVLTKDATGAVCTPDGECK